MPEAFDRIRAGYSAAQKWVTENPGKATAVLAVLAVLVALKVIL